MVGLMCARRQRERNIIILTDEGYKVACIVSIKINVLRNCQLLNGAVF